MDAVALTEVNIVTKTDEKVLNASADNPSFDPDGISLKSFSNTSNPTAENGGDPNPTSTQSSNGVVRKEEYNPYLFRKVKHPTTNTETLLHLLKGSLGTGILAMPNAFSHAGYTVGLCGTFIIGFLCTYCIHMLINAQIELCKRWMVPRMTYPEVAKAALMEGPNWCKKMAPYSGHVVNVFLLIYQLGTCCVYIVFVSENIKSVSNHYIGADISITVYMTIVLIPLILINWVKSLKFLAPFSTIANIITVVSFGIILYYIFRQPPSFDGRVAVGNVREFPLFFGTVLFALEAIGVMLPLENEMKTPQSFGGTTGVLNRGMVVIVILYVAMGFFGYLQYGDKSAGSITLNLPSDTEILAQVVQCTQAFAIIITHAIACYVAIDIAWNSYLKPKISNSKRLGVWEYVLRTSIVVLTYLLAVAVPALDLFISLFGALCLSALGLAFPALIQSCIWWYHISPRRRFFMTLKNGFLVIFGIFGLIVGTYTSLEALIKEFSGSSHK